MSPLGGSEKSFSDTVNWRILGIQWHYLFRFFSKNLNFRTEQYTYKKYSFCWIFFPLEYLLFLCDSVLQRILYNFTQHGHIQATGWHIPIFLRYVQGCMKAKVTGSEYISIDLKGGRKLMAPPVYLNLICYEEMDTFEPIILILSLT